MKAKNVFDKFLMTPTTAGDTVPAQLAKAVFLLEIVSGAVLLCFALYNKNPILIATNLVMMTSLGSALIYLNKTGKYVIPLLITTGLFTLFVLFRAPYYYGALGPTVLSMFFLFMIGPILYSGILAFFSGNLMVLAIVVMIYCEKNSLCGFSPKYDARFYNHWMLLTVVVFQAAFVVIKLLNDMRISQINTIGIEKSMKEVLLRTVAHDLASPLTVIMASISLLEDEELSYDAREHMQSIEKSCQSITSIVKIVREYEAIYSGKKKIDTSDVDLVDCFLSCQAQLNSQIQDKNLTVIIDKEVSLPTVKTNANIITYQIFSNILSNAIKFSVAGSVIRAKFVAHGGAVEVVISDSGIGMDQKRLEHLEMEGELNSTDGTLGESGTGFGIQILLSYARYLGLTVRYARNANKPGTQVSVLFPRTPN